MAFIESIGNALVNPLVSLWERLSLSVPGLIAGILVLAVGYIVGSAFGFLAKTIIGKAKIDDHVKKAGFAHSIGFISIADLIGGIVKWYVFAIFLLPASEVMNLGVLTTFLKDFARWIPDLIAGILIFMAGIIIADYLADRLLNAKRKGVRFLSAAVRWFIIFFAGMTALDQIGINVALAANTTLILIAGFAFGIALAVGIGFGFALKDDAKSVIKGIRKGFG